jgi:hypothetical protein
MAVGQCRTGAGLASHGKALSWVEVAAVLGCLAALAPLS